MTPRSSDLAGYIHGQKEECLVTLYMLYIIMFAYVSCPICEGGLVFIATLADAVSALSMLRLWDRQNHSHSLQAETVACGWKILKLIRIHDGINFPKCPWATSHKQQKALMIHQHIFFFFFYSWYKVYKLFCMVHFPTKHFVVCCQNSLLLCGGVLYIFGMQESQDQK